MAITSTATAKGFQAVSALAVDKAATRSYQRSV
jgi:hypothetical protein